AVECEQEHEGDPTEDGVAAEEVPEGPGIVAGRVERNPVQQVREPDAPDERDAGAANGVRPEPHAPPTCPLPFSSPLERDDADDEEEEEKQECEVEPGEHRSIPSRERRERRAPGDDEPDLVSVPDRADRLEHDATFALVSGNEREEHADAEVEAFE